MQLCGQVSALSARTAWAQQAGRRRDTARAARGTQPQRQDGRRGHLRRRAGKGPRSRSRRRSQWPASGAAGRQGPKRIREATAGAWSADKVLSGDGGDPTPTPTSTRPEEKGPARLLRRSARKGRRSLQAGEGGWPAATEPRGWVTVTGEREAGQEPRGLGGWTKGHSCKRRRPARLPQASLTGRRTQGSPTATNRATTLRHSLGTAPASLLVTNKNRAFFLPRDSRGCGSATPGRGPAALGCRRALCGACRAPPGAARAWDAAAGGPHGAGADRGEGRGPSRARTSKSRPRRPRAAQASRRPLSATLGRGEVGGLGTRPRSLRPHTSRVSEPLEFSPGLASPSAPRRRLRARAREGYAVRTVLPDAQPTQAPFAGPPAHPDPGG